MTYRESLEYLRKTAERGSRPGLERISELMEKLGNPQNAVKTIHVTGTNGKGSFCAILSSVLKSAGYTVGTFSSPAITQVTDSFRINCKEISEKDFSELITEVSDVAEKADDKPTEFEVLTAVAFLMFVRMKCDIAVVECGMGGGLDSTNVISSPLLSVITNVKKDHCGFLGETINEISVHKSGIIKEGRPVYFGGYDENTTIRKKAEEKNAPFFDSDYSFVKTCFPAPICSLSGTSFMYRGMKLNLSLCGTYQFENAVSVLNCIEILRNEGLDIPYHAIKDGFKNARWHGRFEILRHEPLVIFDGSHNPDGMKHTAESIKQLFGKKRVVFLIGVMADKEYTSYANILRENVGKIFTVTPDNIRSLDCQRLADTFIEKKLWACACSDFENGVRLAYCHAKENDMPLIALGSLYMYRQFTQALNKII